MIPADKSRLLTRWLARDAEKRVRRMFGLVAIRGLDRLAATLAVGPVLVVSNHTSWWDPIVIQLLCHRILDADGFALMDAKNLRRLPFFRKVGAFGVDLDDPADGARAMRHAVKLLDRPGRLVWIFPQGREAPLGIRPLGFRRGSAEIGRLAKRVAVLPCAIRYSFGSEERPALHVAFGASAIDDHEAAVTRELDSLDDEAGFVVLHRRRPSWLFRLGERVLAWLTKPRAVAPRSLGGAP